MEYHGTGDVTHSCNSDCCYLELQQNIAIQEPMIKVIGSGTGKQGKINSGDMGNNSVFTYFVTIIAVMIINK